MKYTVAINSYKNAQMLSRCVRNAMSATKGLEAEIIVADSETEEDTEMMMREDFPNIHFFPHKKNVGMGALANCGLKHARGDYIFFINYDSIIDQEALINLGMYLDKNPDVGLVAPKVLNFDGSVQNTRFRFYSPITVLYRRTFLGKLAFAKKHLEQFTMKEFGNDEISEPDWIMGSAMMVRRREVKKIGGFDSRFFMYFEDTDLCRRYWEIGKKVIYFPKARIYHFHGKGSANGGLIRSLLWNKLTWIHIDSALKYFWKYRGKSYPRNNANLPKE
ncbi:MAG: glycosyltransferase family 2 protein [Candidatus Moraniibacteriota bacterium]|nr:MAG: glycosyltransferase family 2 protein [Candidatus Moranbacteria bacterium]